MRTADLKFSGEQISTAITADADLASSFPSDPDARPAAKLSRFGSLVPLSSNVLLAAAASSMSFDLMEAASRAEIFTANFAKKLRGLTDE